MFNHPNHEHENFITSSSAPYTHVPISEGYGTKPIKSVITPYKTIYEASEADSIDASVRPHTNSFVIDGGTTRCLIFDKDFLHYYTFIHT